ncbi:diguanylate cyclase (GGDEF)-like protein [Rhodopseudomonas rhenobacensis]|uniref:Diguanylate cyclase (GGDEF)-like protein n=1 Tax=Rhodopseudomonas rhenobacensis TaxID=87461 RepID=A0A7W7Z471_9BRAD|nr:bifunctional diguanylate cyclase/phosphodiesterase [Rhodopseudomonas rhenobacensis]MBB5047696.1 diguanylate cyclase (GGDEF)-like protein [Rhodopseudomonas rhenobacensis]
MKRAAAVVDHDGRLLLSNSVFDELFGAEGGNAMLARINGEAGRNAGKTSRQERFPNGRTFEIETFPVDQGWLIAAGDVTDHLAGQARAAEAARTDGITGLGNRLMFREQLTRLLHNPDSAAATVALLVVDLDRFKALNASLGRKVGDALLGLVGKRIRSAVAAGDTVARLEADKFGIIQVGQPQPQSADALAIRLVDLIGRAYLCDGQLINVAGSIGVVLPSPGAQDCDHLLKNADLALGRAKKDGHGSYRFFEAEMDERMQARRHLEIDLRRALALREFVLVYQPQVNLRTNTVTGFEALLRWQCPTRGAVSPLDFIPLAEETGVIIPIGEWVLRTACREAAKWSPAHIVAVNVSAVQFGNPNLVSTIISALAESGLDPRRLELEITESVMLDARGTAHAVLQVLRTMGVRVALDDFGTGYSSLGYLRSFPFDKIKIDQSFVRGTSNDPVGAAIVRAIAELGQSLGMATVAEGVETADQLARVASDGCTEVQGYYFSRPMAPDQIESYLSTRNRTNLL